MITKFDLFAFLLLPPVMLVIFSRVLLASDNPVWIILNLIVIGLWLLVWGYGVFRVLPECRAQLRRKGRGE